MTVEELIEQEIVMPGPDPAIRGAAPGVVSSRPRYDARGVPRWASKR
jgi:hypothetical protein